MHHKEPKCNNWIICLHHYQPTVQYIVLNARGKSCRNTDFLFLCVPSTGQDVSFSPEERPPRSAELLLQHQKSPEQQATPPGQQQEEEKCARLYTRGPLQIGVTSTVSLPPPASLSATDWLSCPTSAARLQPREVVRRIKTSTASVSLSSFSAWRATISSRKKKRTKKNCYWKWGLISWTWTKITKDKCSFASQQLLLWSGFPSHSQHLHNMPLAPPAVRE